jgi:hypothetical protein
MLGLGAAAATTQPASASVTHCGHGRCAVYFSKSETRALAQGRVPAAPSYMPGQLKAAYYALAYGHRWFAQQYANRGMCSAFLLSIRPWENQGYTGYSCNWN